MGYKRNWNWGDFQIVCLWDQVPSNLQAYNQTRWGTFSQNL